MAGVRVSVDINATPDQVWAALQQIDRHVEWMHDAVAIRFVDDQTSGVGTKFLCDTKVGPFKLVDQMTITEWQPAAAMGVSHTGVVTGEGKFTLQAVGKQTHFEWEEKLRFPWWLGGPIGATKAVPLVLRPLWRKTSARSSARSRRATPDHGNQVALYRGVLLGIADARSRGAPFRRTGAHGGVVWVSDCQRLIVR